MSLWQRVRRWRWFWRRPRLLSVSHPHRGVVVGDVTAVWVAAKGVGTLGDGPFAFDVDGAYDGPVLVAVPPGATTAVVRFRAGLLRTSLPVVVRSLATPPSTPSAPHLDLSLPQVAIPSFTVSLEVPRP